MVLARKEFDATNEAGDLLTDVSVRVEREGGGLVPVYSDRDGTSSLGNPFMVADGKVAFHVPGGAYRITLTKGAYTRVLRYQPVGLMQESDVGTIAVDIDASGVFAGRAAHNSAAKGFIYLSLNGDGVTGVWTLYMKLSAAAGDWDAGQKVEGTPGAANTLTIGTVTSGPAAATITGTAPNQTLNLVLQPGEDGAEGLPGAPGTPGTTSYDWPFRYAGLPPTNAVLDAFIAGREITFPANFAGSAGFIGTNPTGALTLTIKSGGTWANDGTTVGTISISTGGVFTFATGGGTAKVIAAGTLLKVIGPGSLDATGANIAATLVGDVP